jgi:hypothetical protein
MRFLKLFRSEPDAKRCPRRQLGDKPVRLSIIVPDPNGRFYGRSVDQVLQPDFDGSPRLLPSSWLDDDRRAA